MGPMLPDRALNPRAWAAIHLPIGLGGYGLGFTQCIDESIYWMKESPYPHQLLFEGLRTKKDVSKALAMLRTLNHNPTMRGIPIIQDYAEQMRLQLLETHLEHELDWAQLKRVFQSSEDDDPHDIVVKAERQGWMEVSEFVDYSLRGYVFQSLLMGQKRIEFSPSQWVSQYKRMWNPLLDSLKGLSPIDYSTLSAKEAKELLAIAGKQKWIRINQVTTFDLGHFDKTESPDLETYDFVEMPMDEGFSLHLPTFHVGLRFLGIPPRAKD